MWKYKECNNMWYMYILYADIESIEHFNLDQQFKHVDGTNNKLAT